MNKILIVEDEESILEMLSTILSKPKQFSVFRAIDGEEALRMARDEIPDLIVLDLLLPKINGFDVCASLKSDPATAHIKILMLTGMAQHSDWQKGEEAGVDVYMTKPFSPAVLQKKIEELLRSEKAR